MVMMVFANGAYEVPNVAVDAYAVYTNNVPAGAFPDGWVPAAA